MEYRKKPVVIEAFEFTLKKDSREAEWFLKEIGKSVLVESHQGKNKWFIRTLEGKMEITKGDYVIKGIQGEFYPCKPDIFKATYEKVQ